MDDTSRIATALESIAASLEKLANPQTLVKLAQEEFIAKTMAKKPGKRKSPDHNPEYTEDFLEFWRSYPRKAAKGDAFKAWQQTKESHPADLIKRVKLFSAIWLKKKHELQYCPYPGTWLRGHNWDDDVVTNTSARKDGNGYKVNIQRTVQQESIDHFDDPRWPEYKELVIQKKVKPGFRAWKAANGGA